MLNQSTFLVYILFEIVSIIKLRTAQLDQNAAYRDRLAAYRDRSAAYRDRSAACRDRSAAYRDRSAAYRDRSAAYRTHLAEVLSFCPYHLSLPKKKRHKIADLSNLPKG